LSHRKGKKQKTKQNNNNFKNPKFKHNTVSVSPSASSPSSVIVSSKEEKKKKESGDSFVNVYLRLQLHLPPTVSQLLLQALIIAGLRNELYTHLAPQALFI
jgi:hypothetical protein